MNPTTITRPVVAGMLMLPFLLASCNRSALLEEAAGFNPDMDLLSLHYDHAPDQDDGHSAAADRTILESEFGTDWIADHVVAVSGTYGENAETFNPASNLVMDAAWNDAGGWLAAHSDPDGVRRTVAERWLACLVTECDVWVKEGGQSDLTADVVAQIRERMPRVDTGTRIHVVQHSDWNEEQTTDDALEYVKSQTDYIRISDANSFLNEAPGDSVFVVDAVANERFGTVWQAAFDYYDPDERLDFSDTGELMHILELPELDFNSFRVRYLEP